MGVDKKQCLCLGIGIDIKEGKNTGVFTLVSLARWLV